jgi:hypothetical protein
MQLPRSGALLLSYSLFLTNKAFRSQQRPRFPGFRTRGYGVALTGRAPGVASPDPEPGVTLSVAFGVAMVIACIVGTHTYQVQGAATVGLRLTLLARSPAAG